MKSSIIVSVLFALLIAGSCRKEDNPRVPVFERVPIPLLTLDSTSDTKISGTEPASFKASFTIDNYYKNGDKPKKMDLVVIKNGDHSNPKTVLADITTFPTAFSITGQQLIDLFQEPIVLGDAFEFSTDVTTQAGVKYLGFPLADGIPVAPGINAEPGSNAVLRFAAPCVFDVSKYTDVDFEVVSDEWADYSEGDIVAVAVIDSTHLSFKYKASAAVPIVMEVDPLTNAITVAPVVYGNYSGTFVTAQTLPGDKVSSVDPCDISLTVKLSHTSGPDDFGTYSIVLRKK